MLPYTQIKDDCKWFLILNLLKKGGNDYEAFPKYGGKKHQKN